MARESAAAKGRRYLTEGRLVVTEATPDKIRAVCRGEGATYLLGWRRRGRWWCGCPARTICSHLTALRLVTSPDSPIERRTT